MELETIKVYISPNPDQIDGDNGVGKVVEIQYKYLPEFGVNLVNHPEDADVIASHVFGDYHPRLDVLHLHGAYWSGDKGSGEYNQVHFDSNARIAESCRRARAITMPSHWAGEFLRRDMRLTPVVIPNGVDYDLWQDTDFSNMGYALWNKGRAGDVCDPTPAFELALRSGTNVVSTFAPLALQGIKPPANFKVFGKLPFEKMRKLILCANVYLSTTQECFSVSVLEAMAAGVPILGFAWGGNLEAVRHKIEGYLVEPGDYDGLVAGLEWINANREQVSAACKERAKQFAWREMIGRYADLYRKVLAERLAQQHRVAVVITNYNYARYLDDAIKSCLLQLRKPDHLIIVDDGSTDDSLDVLNRWKDTPNMVDVKFSIIPQANTGVAPARNRGISETDCEYVICLDADDALSPRYIDALLPALQNDPTLGVVWSKVGLMAADGQPLNQIWDWNFTWEAQSDPVNFKNGIPAGAMFRRSMWERVGGYKQCYHPAEDAEFWLRGLSIGFKAKRVADEPLFYYRTHEDSAVHKSGFQFPSIFTWHPWSTDKQYPMAAPARVQPLIRSYSQPLVTVVIPVGPGHDKLLPTALESLLGQDCRAWEVIAVNDSGADLSRVLKPYPFVRLLQTAGAEGASHARNLGLKAVKTTLVLWLDADDYLMPDALTKMIRAYAESGGGRYVYSDWLSVNGNELTPFTAPDYSQEGWLENGLHAVTVLMETEQARKVGGFDENLTGWEDWDFFIKCAVAGFCGMHLPEPLFGYRVQTGTRREDSQKLRVKLLAIFREKYGKYFSGKDGRAATMAKQRCCGGNGAAVLAAKGLLDAGDLQQQQQSANGGVAIEYIGDYIAPVTYHGEAGRKYLFGNNNHDKTKTVPQEDWTRLEATGKFKLAGR